MATKLLAGSPGAQGNKSEASADIDGLASYVLGGQTIQASAFGLKAIESIECGASDNAAHIVKGRFSAKGPQASVKLVWIVVGTGAEVAGAVNLSGRFVRVRATGY